MKLKKSLLAVIIVFSLVTLLNAQLSRRTGTIEGVIADEGGLPLPGVNITVEGPTLQGKVTAVSRSDGTFTARGIPPGTFTLTAQLEGFQGFKNEGLVVHVGMTLTLNFTMKPAALQEQVTVIGKSPVVDIKTNKTTLILDATTMERIPLNRNVFAAIAMAPGALPAGNVGGTSSEFIVHGGTGISQTFDVDGVNVNWAADYGIWFGELGYDSMEEVEVMTAGIPAEDTVPGGGLINVVTKSGGNSFHGQLQTYYTNENLSQFLFAKEYYKSLGLAQPGINIYDVEPTLQIGGPIFKDRLWFFTDLGFWRIARHSTFIPVTIQGVEYGTYDNWQNYLKGMGKLSFMFSDNLRGNLMVSYVKRIDPQNGGTRTVPSAISEYRDVRWKFNSSLTWFLNKDLFLDFRFGMAPTIDWITPPAGAENNPQIYDAYTGYTWGAPGRLRHSFTNNIQGVLNVTSFMNDLLGGNHEFKAGLLYQFIYYKWPWFREDPRDITWYNGSPYYFRQVYGLKGPHPTFGDGYLNIRYCAPKDGDSYSQGNMLRFGGFVQDSFNIKNRLTINLGVRYDFYRGYLPAVSKKACAPLSEAIGAYALTPLFGFNALGAMSIPAWDPALQWGALSPRLGFSYDLFGNGKTALKGSFSVYSDFMSTMYFDTSHPFREWSIAFNWWDLNGNGDQDLPGIDDYKYYAISKNPAEMDPSFYTKTVDSKGTKSPMYWEYTLGVIHELTTDFSAGLQFIYKYKTNTVNVAYWDPATGRNWYTYEQAPDWWIPFKTLVPKVDDYPEQEVTLYFMSKNAPLPFRRFMNIPEAKRNYYGLELTFDKRMSHGWALGGSVVLSKTRGNNSGAYGDVWGYSNAYNQANWWVNRYGSFSDDRLYIIKLYGAFQMPWNVVMSFSARHYSGAPFNRTVTVFPPAQWAKDNNAQLYSYMVNVEKQGARMTPDETWVDFRLEKEFSLGQTTRLGFFVDVFNLFGYRLLTITYNPGGNWQPIAENTNKGTYVRNAYYGKATGSSANQRVFKFSFRFRF